jgi:C1A family cysteine protease
MRYGHRHDPASVVRDDVHNRHVGALLGPHMRLASSIDYSGLLDHVPDQLSTSSCVGCAFSTAVYLRAAVAGNPIARPSRKAIYDVARMIEAPHAPLADEGSVPSLAIQGMRDYGMVAEDRWPLTDDAVNVMPPLDVFQHAVDATLGEHYRITAGAGASMLIKMALSRGYVPALAIPVEQAFEDYSSGVYNWTGGPALGSHMVACVGFDSKGLLICNSWGPSWGMNGLVRVAESFVDIHAADILVVTTAPKAVA